MRLTNVSYNKEACHPMETMPQKYVSLTFDKGHFSLHGDGQVHTWVDSAVQIEGSCCCKWADGSTIVAEEGYVDGGCATFDSRFGGCAFPGPVRDDMC